MKYQKNKKGDYNLTYNVVSLFSGAGGMDLGFVNQGFKIVWANDFNKSACETYKNNFGDHIVCGDITQIKSEDIPDCDIVIGGSPCQGFSVANRQTGFLDNPKNFLVKEFIRVVKDKKPKVFVLENVPQIITVGNGKFIKEIINTLNEYNISVKVLNAADYGVPQKRKRCIVIGSLVGKINLPEPTQLNYITIEQALQGLHNEIPNQKDIANSSETVRNRFKQVPQGGNWKNIKEFEGKYKHSILYRRLSLDEVCFTFPHAAKNLIIHPTEDRILSVRECARILSFPDNFVFHGGLNDKYQQVANAVPPLMAEAIAKEIKNVFNEYSTKNQVNTKIELVGIK